MENFKDSSSEAENKEKSFKAKKMMMATLKDYSTGINNAAQGLRPSRSQGRAKNDLFGEILRDLHDYANGKILSYRIPEPYFTPLEEDAVEITDLTDFLNEEVERLKQVPHDFAELQECLEGFKVRMAAKLMQ